MMKLMLYETGVYCDLQICYGTAILFVLGWYGSWLEQPLETMVAAAVQVPTLAIDEYHLGVFAITKAIPVVGVSPSIRENKQESKREIFNRVGSDSGLTS